LSLRDFVSFLLFLLLPLITVTAARSADVNTPYLCYFGKILVPCERLKHPLSLDGFHLARFRPAKWIPITPSNAIFGFEEDDNEKYKPEYYDRTIAYRYSPLSIEFAKLFDDVFDSRFVDESLSYMSTWLQPRQRYALGLVETSKAFRGAEILEYWKRSLLAGIVCEHHTKSYASGAVVEKMCAFASWVKGKPSNLIEYCTYDVDFESGIRGAVNCNPVADISASSPRILATRYVYYDFSGGAYAGQFRCRLPTQGLEQIRRALGEFLKHYLGPSSGTYFFADNHYRAEGINVEDREEHMFVRTAVSGDFSGARHYSYGGYNLSADVSFSVSAQSTDDITNYREPNSAMTKRLMNHFERELKLALPENSTCWFEG
jgi:hypothetical protein